MLRDRSPLTEQIRRPGPKRMLSLDGGGIRGLIALEILGRLEELLRAAHGGDPAFVLADYFDYVAGTSTGAIIATCVALGLPVDTIRNFYLAGSEAMFKRAPWFKLFYSRLLDDAISAQLRKQLQHSDGRDRTLGHEDIRTLLLVVMRNATTDSPWPISNNPFAKYNARDVDGCNLDIPLWQIIRASTAAPTYFPAQEITVGTKAFTFVDGAVTVYNNPALVLFLMATLPEYRLEWEVGEDKLLLVSVGTGVIDTRAISASQMTLLYNLKSVPSALIAAALNEQDLLCRVFGRCRFGDPLDSELEDLIVSDEAASSSGLGQFGPKKFTYVRYNAPLSRAGLDALGLQGVRPEDVQRLAVSRFMPELMAVGKAYAARVDLAHLGPFDPRRTT